MDLSIVIPCYNEDENIQIFYETLDKAVKGMYLDRGLSDYEFLFVDDGSSDTTLSIIKRLVKNDPHIYFISFTRNFGKEAAMLAGLSKSRGDYVAIMDADLQDPPEYLPEMMDILKKDGG